MNIKGISIVVAGTLIFIIAGLLINKVGKGDHLKLLKWSINMSIILLIFSLMFSLYGDYLIDKSFDFYIFGVYDSKQFYKDYFFVVFNIFFLIFQMLIKMVIRSRGVTSFTEPKINMFITASLFVIPVLQIGYAGSVFNLW